MDLCKNAFIQWHRGGTTWLERVLFVDLTTRNTVFIRLEKRSQPFWRTGEEIDSATKAGDFHVLDLKHDPFLRPGVDRATLEPEQADHWDKLWRVIKVIADDPKRRIFGDPKDQSSVIAEASESSGLDRKTISYSLWKFWSGGQTPQCLLPDYRCNKGKKRAFKGGAKRGRKSVSERNEGKSIGIIITPDVEAKLLQGINKFYVQNGGNSLHDAYSATMAEFFHAGFEEQDGILVPVVKPDEEVPTPRQFLYVYYKHRDPEAEAKGRQGENSYELKGRPITGNSETSVMGPGMVAQIDWTTADIYLRSDHDPRLTVGRPVLYAMIDVWGRFFYSLVITFEHGGYWSAAIALENALVDKVGYCAQYGMDLGPDEWPVQFLPEQLIVDGGELSTKKASHLVTGLGIQISTLPPRRGDLKGIVERCFGRIDGQLVAWLPGALPRLRGQNEKSSPLDAVLTVSQFRRLAIEAVRRFHRQTLKRYRPTKDLIAAGVRYSPIELLKWGLKHRSGRMLHFPLDQARLQLLPGGEARVTHEGVYYRKLLYTCERAVEEGWYQRARRCGDYPISVADDPRLVDRIFLRGPKTTVLEPLVLTESFLAFQGWTWAEVEEYYKEKKREAEENRHQELQDKVRVQAAVTQVKKTAQEILNAINAANPPKSKAAQVRTTAANQAEFRHQERIASVQAGTARQNAAPAEPDPRKIVQFPVQPAPPVPPPVPAIGLTAALRNKLNKLKHDNAVSK